MAIRDTKRSMLGKFAKLNDHSKYKFILSDNFFSCYSNYNEGVWSW